uniref:Uncharacterized protein n=1 Tax=Plectus sambesii TaxID=2011161 RepID=A0A914UKV6_9BILA
MANNQLRNPAIRRVISLSTVDNVGPRRHRASTGQFNAIHIGSVEGLNDHGGSVISIPVNSMKKSNSLLIQLEPTNYDHDDDQYVSSFRCSWMPCCMDHPEATTFGHHVSICMVALVAFATFFCVTLILVLVFLLG